MPLESEIRSRSAGDEPATGGSDGLQQLAAPLEDRPLPHINHRVSKPQQSRYHLTRRSPRRERIDSLLAQAKEQAKVERKEAKLTPKQRMSAKHGLVS